MLGILSGSSLRIVFPLLSQAGAKGSGEVQQRGKDSSLPKAPGTAQRLC